MRYSTLTLSLSVLLISPLVQYTPKLSMPLTPREAGRPDMTACTALGNYPVGPRASLQARVAARQLIEPPPSPWRLAGNIILTAYSGCGRPTTGTFAIQGVLMGTPEEQNGMTVTVPCALSCLGPPLVTISGRGTFRQDAAHPHDPLYVTITAVLAGTQGRPRSQAALTNITGYLEVRSAQHARLSFLPPPTLSFLPSVAVNAGIPPVPLVIYGWRGM